MHRDQIQIKDTKTRTFVGNKNYAYENIEIFEEKKVCPFTNQMQCETNEGFSSRTARTTYQVDRVCRKKYPGNTNSFP